MSAETGEIGAAIAAARTAQIAWAARSPRERARVLDAALARLRDRPDEIAELLAAETGKTPTEALVIEVFAACDFLNHYARRAPRLLGPERRRMHLFWPVKSLRVYHRPLGVVAVLVPWIDPLVHGMRPVVQALAAGNAVLLKPSEKTPRVGRWLAELFVAGGLPPDLLHLIEGGPDTGRALASSDVDKVFFTGSEAAGRDVARICADRLTPVSLSLGGKEAMIVCADANLERAAAGALYGGMLNAGQMCVSTERVYVVEAVAEPFVEALARRARALVQGAGPDVDVGALVDEERMAAVEELIAEACAQGASVVVGGRRARGLEGPYLEPTILVDVDERMRIMHEKILGPVIAVRRVADDEHALRLANGSRYGLGAQVWTSDRRRALALAARLEVGAVSVNEWCFGWGATEAPFAGRRASGAGGSDLSLRDFTHPQAVLVDRLARTDEEAWYPLRRTEAGVTRRLLRAIFGTALGRRWFS